MYRLGIVTVLEPATCRARVRFPDLDGVQSGWLAVMQHKTLRDKVYWMPDVNEHVACIMDEHDEEGAIIGAIYSEADTPPESNPDIHRVDYDNGTEWTHNRATSEWILNVPAEGKILFNLGQSSIEVTDAHIKLTCGGASIEITPNNITAIAARIDLNP